MSFSLALFHDKRSARVSHISSPSFGSGGEQSAGGPEQGSFVNIEYLTWPIIRYKREVLFGWVDLLVSFGGIAGLFLGFSLLSGVEIVYYFTMRACCMVYKNRDVLYRVEEEKWLRKMGGTAAAVQQVAAAPAALGQHEPPVQVIPMGHRDVLGPTPDLSLAKRVNRANMKLQVARELARQRFDRSNGRVGPMSEAVVPVADGGQFGYMP